MTGTQRRMALALVLGVAFAARLVDISLSPNTVHPTRQYAGLGLAKDWYTRLRPGPPAERAAVRANGDRAPRLEPRLLEALTVVGYLVLGGVHPWFAGTVSSIAWCTGGLCLYLLARRLASELAGWVALVVYLFLPYVVIATRTFQPDPSMVAAMVGALLLLVRWTERPTTARLVAAASAAGGAVLLKPAAGFLLAGAFAALTVSSGGVRGLLRPATLWYGAVAVLPTACFYLFELAGGDQVAGFAQGGFLPRLWLQSAYWSGWLHLIHVTVTLPVAVGGALAAVVARRREGRALIAGLLAGYVAFGLVFNYHIHTHDYYHLPLVPVVALGLGLTVDAGFHRLRTAGLTPLLRLVGAAGLAVGALALVVADVRVLSLPAGAVRRQLAADRAMGEAVGHSTRTVALSGDYGYGLFYEGSFSGAAWPSAHDLEVLRSNGAPRFDAADTFEGDARRADWFVVADLAELARQPRLAALLALHGSLTAEGPGYRVYRLRPD